MFNDVSDAEIRRQGKRLQRSHRAISFRTLPQLRDLWVIDADGHPLVSGTVYPMPRDLALADRDYFSAHKTSDVDTFISGVVAGTRRRHQFLRRHPQTADAAGKFDGVYLVSIAPEYFTRYYSRVSGQRRHRRRPRPAPMA